MARFTFQLARKANPKKQIGSVTVIGKSLKSAKATAGKLLGAMNRGLTSARAPNRRRKANRKPRRKKNLSFGQRMARLRKRKANSRKRTRR
jgi:hypothetical protein